MTCSSRYSCVFIAVGLGLLVAACAPADDTDFDAIHTDRETEVSPAVPLVNRWVLPRDTQLPVDGVMATGGSGGIFLDNPVQDSMMWWEATGEPAICRREDGVRPQGQTVMQLAFEQNGAMTLEGRGQFGNCDGRAGIVRFNLPTTGWVLRSTDGERDQYTVAGLDWDAGMLTPTTLDLIYVLGGVEERRISLSTEGTFDPGTPPGG